MGDFSRWLLHDDQKELFEYLYATVLNVVFLLLATLLLWSVDKTAMALQLAKGYWVFWIVLILTAVLVTVVQRLFRVDIDSHVNAYVFSALAVGGFLQTGWSAFAALTVDSFVAGAPGWIVAILYGVGILSCYIAYAAVSALYVGSLYRLVNLGIAVVSFVIFSVWPAAGSAIYGWFFELSKTI